MRIKHLKKYLISPTMETFEIHFYPMVKMHKWKEGKIGGGEGEINKF